MTSNDSGLNGIWTQTSAIPVQCSTNNNIELAVQLRACHYGLLVHYNPYRDDEVEVQYMWKLYINLEQWSKRHSKFSLLGQHLTSHGNLTFLQNAILVLLSCLQKRWIVAGILASKSTNECMTKALCYCTTFCEQHL